MGVTVEKWREMMVDLRNVGLVSASTRMQQDQEEMPAPEFPTEPASHPDNICIREQMRTSLGAAMKSLPERYKMVVTMYYTNDMTMKEIGTAMGINESRVSQIHKAALEKMGVALELAGIRSVAAFA